jgi:peptide/nickel transport system ATP-binding protein
MPAGDGMNALVEMSRLSVSMPGPSKLFDRFLSGGNGRFNILDDVSLAVGRGETFGLVGESGSGKTTLARAMLGLLPVSTGTLRFDGTELSAGSDFAVMRRQTSMMFQDAVASLSPRMSVGSLVTEPLVINGIAMKSRQAKAGELLSLVGLPEDMARRYPHELSGGQARRVGVARALALDPKLIIADEPTAGLDVSVQGEILNLLNGLKNRLGLSYLVITHNLALVRHVADRIGVMYLGRLVETGPTMAVFRSPLHPYTKSLIAAEPKPDPRKRRVDLAIKGEIPSVLRRPSAQPRCRSEAPMLREIAPGRHARCHFAGTLTEH